MRQIENFPPVKIPWPRKIGEKKKKKPKLNVNRDESTSEFSFYRYKLYDNICIVKAHRSEVGKNYPTTK